MSLLHEDSLICKKHYFCAECEGKKAHPLIYRSTYGYIRPFTSIEYPPDLCQFFKENFENLGGYSKMILKRQEFKGIHMILPMNFLELPKY